MDYKIDILDEGLRINSILLTLPLSLHRLIEVLGQDPNRISELSNNIYTWDPLGLYCYSKNTPEQSNQADNTDREIHAFAILIYKFIRCYSLPKFEEGTI